MTNRLEYRKLLLKVAFHKDIFRLKKKQNEKIETVHPLELLKRWINFQFKINSKTLKISNIKSDLKDCLILSQLLFILSQNENFLSISNLQNYYERALKILDFLKETDYTGFLFNPNNLIKGDEPEIIQFLVNIFLWKPNLKEIETEKEDQENNKNQNLEVKTKQKDFDYDLVLSTSSTSTDFDFDSDFDSQEDTGFSQDDFTNPIQQEKFEMISNNQLFDFKKKLKTKTNENENENQIKNENEIENENQIKNENENENEKISIKDEFIFHFLDLESFSFLQFQEMHKIEIIIQTFSKIFEEIDGNSNNTDSGKLAFLQRLKMFHLRNNYGLISNLNRNLFFQIINDILKSDFNYFNPLIQQQINQELLAQDNYGCDPLYISSQIKGILQENCKLEKEADLSLSLLFDLFTFTMVVKQQITTRLTSELIADSFINPDQMKLIRNIIYKSLDTAIFGLIDFINLTKILKHYFSFFTEKDFLSKSQLVVSQTIKIALGNTIRAIVNRILDDKSKELVEKSIAKINQEFKSFGNEKNTNSQVIEKGMEILGGYLFVEDIIFLQAALDEENCLSFQQQLVDNFYYLFLQLDIFIPMIKFLVSRQIITQKNSDMLFRANDVLAKILTKYSSHFAKDYLHETFHDIVDEIFDRIIETSDKIPFGFRIITSHIRNEMQIMGLEEFEKAIGSLIFLRFLCPAILLPISFGIIDYSIDPESERGLLLLSSTIQALGTGKQFGSNRVYLQPLNQEIQAKSSQTTELLKRISNFEGEICYPTHLTMEKILKNTPLSFLAQLYQSQLKNVKQSKANGYDLFLSVRRFIKEKKLLQNPKIEIYQTEKMIRETTQLDEKTGFLIQEIEFIEKLLSEISTKHTEKKSTIGTNESQLSHGLNDKNKSEDLSETSGETEYSDSLTIPEDVYKEKEEVYEDTLNQNEAARKFESGKTFANRNLFFLWKDNWKTPTLMEGFGLMRRKSKKKWSKVYFVLKLEFLAIYENLSVNCYKDLIDIIHITGFLKIVKLKKTSKFNKKKVKQISIMTEVPTKQEIIISSENDFNIEKWFELLIQIQNNY
ncbi:ras gtpase-activating protein [Anaeramoeba ignava]|uniref:Ras gtpase-activating protein n=1 Tax=Anaeramoeba ignava TaxID=1746090 RepID=A0A9Q0L888_ANAIG|nr:ras gtpase-activating protein [Anaeramoeba ignava]